MNRIEVIQKIINTLKAKTYLEIGLRYGQTFLSIRAQRKMGVDPVFQLGKKVLLKGYLSNRTNFNNKYFFKTSDLFFLEETKMLSKNKVEVAFIDGFHQFEQAYRDVQNVLKNSKENAVIVLHDCSPTSKEAAMPYDTYAAFKNNHKSGNWNGDVWKAIVMLRSTYNDLNVFVLNCDHGLGIITKGRNKLLPYSIEEIQRMNYDFLDSNRSTLLNLKEPELFYDFLESLGSKNL